MDGLVWFFALGDVECVLDSCLEGVDCMLLILGH